MNLTEHSSINDAIENVLIGNVRLYPNTVSDFVLSAETEYSPAPPPPSTYRLTVDNEHSMKVNIPMPAVTTIGKQSDPDYAQYWYNIKFRDGSYLSYFMEVEWSEGTLPMVVYIGGTIKFHWMQSDGTFIVSDGGTWGSRVSGTWDYWVYDTGDPSWPPGEPEPVHWWSTPVVYTTNDLFMAYIFYDAGSFYKLGYGFSPIRVGSYDISSEYGQNSKNMPMVQYFFVNGWQDFYDFLGGSAAEGSDYPGSPSGAEGGDGYQLWPDMDILGGQLPTINPLALGMVKLYNPSDADIRAMATWLWSDDFDTNIKKNYVSPFDNIISLAACPLNIPDSNKETGTYLIVGNVTSSVAMPKVINPFGTLDCGELPVNEGYGGFLDYDVNMTLWLPFIGFRSIMPDDVMKGKIWIRYRYDLLTGLVVAEVFAIKRNLKDGNTYTKCLGNYTGNFLYHIPISGANYMSMYNQQLQATVAGNQNFLNQVGSAASGIAQLFTGNIAGALGSALDIMKGNEQQKLYDRQYETAKPEYGRGGSVGGSAGLFSTRYPYLISSIPLDKVPDKYNDLIGIPLEGWYTIKDLAGYTEVREVKIDFDCRDDEKDEIIRLLKNGIYI